MAFDKKGTLVLNGISYSGGSSGSGGGSSIPWTYIKELDLSGNDAVSIPELDDYDEFYIHSDTDFDILNQYFIKDVTPRINVGAFSSTTYYCLVLGTIDWTNKTIKKDAYAHNGWSTSCKFKLYGRKLTSSGGGGSSDYSELTNKPQINNVELSGNKSADDLGLLTEVPRVSGRIGNRFLVDATYQSFVDAVCDFSETTVNTEEYSMFKMGYNAFTMATNQHFEQLDATVGQANDLLEGAL